MLSQSFFTHELDLMVISAETVNDIRDIDLSSVEPYVYNKIPDLSSLSPSDRKQKFINLILPSILIEKHKIELAYNYVINNFDSLYFNNETKDLYEYCQCEKREDLLYCLTEQPTSIIIAQAAIESGWGTSRFFLEGYNLFGMHTYRNDHNKIIADNSSLVYVKKYNNMSESISHYLRTLAKVGAYNEFRKKRAQLISVENMIQHLDKYSERRQLYVNDIQTIIEYNNLTRYDSVKINYQ